MEVQLREKRNLICFIISYVINNLVSGVLYDTYVNYLQETAPSIATSFWSFYGYATFISALILILVPKAGYKKLLIFCSLSCTSALFSVIWFQSEALYYVTTLLSLVGVQLHYIILSPYVATYTEHLKKKKHQLVHQSLLYGLYRLFSRHLSGRRARGENVFPASGRHLFRRSETDGICD